MSRIVRFTSPEELRQYTEQQQDGHDDEKLRVQLALLLPLSDPSVLAVSQEAGSKHTGRGRDQHGRWTAHTDETLDSSALYTSWRKEWAPFLRRFGTSIVSVSFDAMCTVPHIGDDSPTTFLNHLDDSSSSEVEREIWSTQIDGHGFIRLVVTLATEARFFLKRRGGEVKFYLVPDTASGWDRRLRRSLDGQLGRLSM